MSSMMTLMSATDFVSTLGDAVLGDAVLAVTLLVSAITHLILYGKSERLTQITNIMIN